MRHHATYRYPAFVGPLCVVLSILCLHLSLSLSLSLSLHIYIYIYIYIYACSKESPASGKSFPEGSLNAFRLKTQMYITATYNLILLLPLLLRLLLLLLLRLLLRLLLLCITITIVTQQLFYYHGVSFIDAAAHYVCIYIYIYMYIYTCSVPCGPRGLFFRTQCWRLAYRVWYIIR